MHVVFIPYGKRSEVEELFKCMEAQKYVFPMWKGKKTKTIWMGGGLRQAPFGVWEYIFPKEAKDIVLATLSTKFDPKKVSWWKLAAIRKLVECDPIPEFSKEKIYPWTRQFVRIFLIGIREDGEIVGKGELDRGWTHEAL